MPISEGTLAPIPTLTPTSTAVSNLPNTAAPSPGFLFGIAGGIVAVLIISFVVYLGFRGKKGASEPASPGG